MISSKELQQGKNMSIKGWFRWAVSPEGIRLNRAPKKTRLITKHLCQMMAIGVYEFSKPKLFLVARYIAQNPEQCLFLLHRFHEEVNLQFEEQDDQWRYTRYFIQRIFGEDGWDTLSAACELYTSRDGQMDSQMKYRGAILAQACSGYIEDFKKIPEFDEGVKIGRSLGMTPANADDVMLAYVGLHHKWFTQIFDKRLEAWLALESANELMASLHKIMNKRINS